MENFYILRGNDKVLLEEKRREIIEKIELDNPEENVIFFDFTESDFSEILQELTTYSFFSEKKCIIVHHFEDKKMDNALEENFYQYLKNPISEHFLIFEIVEENFNQGFLNEIKRFGKMVLVNSMTKEDMEEYVKAFFKKENISADTIAMLELLKRCDYKYDLLKKEIEKIVIFFLNDKDNRILRFEDVVELVPRNMEENIFVLTSYILEKNKTKALESFYDLLMNGEDGIRILNIITRRIKEILYVKVLSDQRASKEEIASYFGISSGKAYYLMKDSSQFSKASLEIYFNQLIDLDFKIKSGQIDKNTGVELFILNL